MDRSDGNPWAGKSADYVLAKSFHGIRIPVLGIAGYLSVVKSMDLSDEHARHFLDAALSCALSAKDIVESVYQYINENHKEQ